MTYIDTAIEKDRKDPLRSFRSRFIFPDASLIYVDGNSLGPLSFQSEQRMQKAVESEWGTRLIRGWNDGWWDLPVKLGNELAHLIGAREGEVLVCDSTSVNLFKLVWAALTMQSDRSKLVTDELNFPSDLYIMQGILKNHPGRFQLDLLESHDGNSVHPDEVDKKIDGHTALVCLSHVSFKSAFMYDMHAVTSRAHSQGAMVLWDLSHAAGAVPVDLNGSGADLAVGCTYKYLNGGPGSPAYLYVRKELQEQLQPPIWGWFGVSNPFDFSLEFDPYAGIRRFLVGSPPILSMIPVETGLKMIREAGMDRIREKSLAQSEFFMKMVTKVLLEHGYTIGSPREPGQRGSHVSLRHPEGYRICQALADPVEGAYTILPDFREPDHIRIGIAPLYNTFEELVVVVQELKRIVENRIYEKYSPVRETVT